MIIIISIITFNIYMITTLINTFSTNPLCILHTSYLLTLYFNYCSFKGFDKVWDTLFGCLFIGKGDILSIFNIVILFLTFTLLLMILILICNYRTKLWVTLWKIFVIIWNFNIFWRIFITFWWILFWFSFH